MRNVITIALAIFGLVVLNNADCPDGKKCTPYYKCDEQFDIENNTSLIDSHVNDESICPNVLDVCCTPSKIMKGAAESVVAFSEKCGIRNPDGVGFRITGAAKNEAQFGEFPWMVAVLTTDNSDQNFFKGYHCSGSLIHPDVVLTAAHCVDGKSPNSLKIRAGEWDIQTTSELLPHQDRSVREIVIHENFNKEKHHNDIALLLLKSPVNLADNVDIVCLPPVNTNFDQSRCFLTGGWGETALLENTEMTIISSEKCQNKLKETGVGVSFPWHRSYLCAGGENGTGARIGDSGAPLVCPIASKGMQYYQAGIVLFSAKDKAEFPTFFTNVSELRSWIDEQMKTKKIINEPQPL